MWRVTIERHNTHPRNLEWEIDLLDFFETEIFERVRVIMQHTSPDAIVQGIVGSWTMHADYFLVLTVKTGGCLRRSAICVEFKFPFENSLASEQSRQASSRNDDESDPMMRAGFPTIGYGNITLCMHLGAYARSGGAVELALRNLRCFINCEWGLLTTFNSSWIAKFTDVSEPLSASNMMSTIAVEQTQRTRPNYFSNCYAATPNNASSSEICVTASTVFRENDANPHIAFMFVYVLESVLTDMRANPEKYCPVHI